MSVLFPRLPDSVASGLYTELGVMPVAKLSERAASRHPMQIYAATGGGRASDADVAAVRQTILQVASDFGFPRACSDVVGFDRRLAPKVHHSMQIVPAEAANRHVWSFVALVVAPDVTSWRFGGTNRERWIASDLTRHMFARLWWQAHLLVEHNAGVVDTSLLDALSESDLNQLLERTTIGGTRTLVRSLARSVLASEADVPRRLLIREAALRMRRRMAFIDHLALDTGALRSETDRMVREAELALAADGDAASAEPGDDDAADLQDSSAALGGSLADKFNPRPHRIQPGRDWTKVPTGTRLTGSQVGTLVMGVGGRLGDGRSPNEAIRDAGLIRNAWAFLRLDDGRFVGDAYDSGEWV